MPITDGPGIAAICRSLKTVAVLGAHDDEHKPAHYVPASLHAKGVRILPINPTKIGTTLFGEEVRESLASLAGSSVDLVNVFRRSADVPGHVDDILAMTPRPRVVWLQLGIRHAGAAARLEAAGIRVVEDRCLMVDHDEHVPARRA